MSRLSYFGPGLTVPLNIAGLRAHEHLLLVPLVAAACVVLAMLVTSSETRDIAKDIQDESIEEDYVEAPPPAGLPVSLWQSFTTKGRGETSSHDYRVPSDAKGKSTSKKTWAPDDQKAIGEPDFEMFTGPPLRIPPRRLDSVSSEDLSLGPISRPSTALQFDNMNDDTTSSEARSTLRANAKAFVPTRSPLRPNASPFTPGRLGLRATTPVINRTRDSRLRADAPKFSPKRKSRCGDAPKFTSGRKVLRAGAPAFTPGRIGFRSAELVLPPRKALRSDAPPFTPGPLAKFTKNQPQCSN